MIKLCAWNIQAGGGSRALSIVKSAIKSKSNIITFNEFRNNDTGTSIRGWLLKAGYRYQVVTAALKNDNSVLIASTLPFSSELHPVADETFPHNIVTAHFSAFSVIGVYLPHKKKHKLLEYLIDLVSNDDRPYIIAGDYNTGINFVDQKGKSFWYTDQLSKLGKAGYCDAFRLVNGEVSEFSWYSHQGNGYRYDHIYIDEDISALVKDCSYDHQWRLDKLSDHSPMFLELG